MHLSPEDIAAAEACGVSFLPASHAQVQRFAMQRKVFYRAGAPILATRGDGLFETAGTLQQLIEEGRQQQRDLSQWLQAAEPEATLETVSEAAEPAPLPELLEAEAAAPPPRRPRQKRRRPELVAPDLAASEPTLPETVAEEAAAAVPEVEPTGAALLPALPHMLGRAALRMPPAVAQNLGQDPGKRWLMAGAARRGRAGKHWSTRQR